MKKRMLFAMLIVVPALCPAQTDDNAFNDSTEYVFQPKTVIDTALVEAVGRAYNDYHLTLLNGRINTMKQESQTLKAIAALEEKEPLSADNGTLTLYTSLLEELKSGSERSSAFVRHGYWRNTSNTKTNILGMPKGMNATLEEELTKAEKQLTKKQRTYPTIVNYAKWLDKENAGKLRLLEREAGHFNNGFLFNAYRDSMGNNDYPQRVIHIKVKNEYYRPSLMQPYYNYGKLDKIDERLQERGWEWIDKDEHTSASESYPISYSYQKYESHPEYKVVYCVFDAEGKLVRVPSMNRGFVSDHIEKILLNLDYRKDYADNKYDIKKEDKDVQYVIVNKLGLSSDNEARIYGAMAKAYGAAFNAEYGNLSQKIKAGQQKKEAEKVVLQQIFRMMNDTADKFLEQLKKDHEGDYKYIYKIERLTDVSFKIHFVTKDVKPRCGVVVSFHGTGPYKCDWQIDDISRY